MTDEFGISLTDYILYAKVLLFCYVSVRISQIPKFFLFKLIVPKFP